MLARSARSSRRTQGGRKIEPKSPARIRAWCPTITFSTAVIAPNSRMFWKVRATPCLVITSGRARVMSRSPSRIRPSVGRYSPVSMLNSVVFPAPFGPISDTIDVLRNVERYVVDGDQAAEHLRDVLRAQD